MMKLQMLAVIAACFLVVGCGGSNQPKSEATDASAVADTTGASVPVDVSASMVEWTGYKPAGKHFGTLGIKSGELKMTGANLTGGTFTFDMNSITVKDLDEKSGKAKLEGHLKSPDFFDVEKNGEGKFVITKVTEEKTDSTTHRIEGNLTLKGQEKGIAFPAKITMNDGGKKVKAVASFSIDRTQFGIVYNSKKDEGFMKKFEEMKDKLINDNIDLKLNVVTTE